jgi:hypothetical protein
MEKAMRVHEELLQTVAFIGSQQSNGTFQAMGTGFFVGVDPDYPYLVTALHVAQHLQDQSYVMRFNPQPYGRARGGNGWTSRYGITKDQTLVYSSK